MKDFKKDFWLMSSELIGFFVERWYIFFILFIIGLLLKKRAVQVEAFIDEVTYAVFGFYLGVKNIYKNRKKEGKFYLEWVYYCLLTYICYLFFWYCVFYHINYFWSERFFEIVQNVWGNVIMYTPERRIVRKSRFSKIAMKIADFPKVREKYFSYIFWIVRYKFLAIVAFLFIIWNTYYISSTFSYKIEGWIDVTKCGLYLITLLTLAQKLDMSRRYIKHYISYLFHTHYSYISYFLGFLIVLPVGIAIELMIDEDEEIDLYNMNLNVDSFYMENRYGGTKLTGLFWDLSLQFYKVIAFIWRITNIIDFWFGSEKKHQDIKKAAMVYRGYVIEFMMKRQNLPRTFHVHFYSPIKLRKYNRITNLRKRRLFSLEFRKIVFYDGILMRFFLWFNRYIRFLYKRINAIFTAKKVRVDYTTVTVEEKKHMKHWKRFKIRHLSKGNKIAFGSLDKDLFFAKAAREYTHTMEYTDYYMITYDAKWKDEQVFLKEGGSKDRKIIRKSYTDWVKVIRLDFFSHLTKSNPRLHIEWDRAHICNMLFFGIYLHKKGFLLKENAKKKRLQWRLLDIQSFLYPVFLNLILLLDPKNGSIGWKSRYKFFRIGCVNSNHLKSMLNVEFNIDAIKLYYTNRMISVYEPSDGHQWEWRYSPKLSLKDRYLSLASKDILPYKLPVVGDFNYIINSSSYIIYEEQHLQILEDFAEYDELDDQFKGNLIKHSDYLYRSQESFKHLHNMVKSYNFETLTMRSYFRRFGYNVTFKKWYFLKKFIKNSIFFVWKLFKWINKLFNPLVLIYNIIRQFIVSRIIEKLPEYRWYKKWLSGWSDWSYFFFNRIKNSITRRIYFNVEGIKPSSYNLSGYNFRAKSSHYYINKVFRLIKFLAKRLPKRRIFWVTYINHAFHHINLGISLFIGNFFHFFSYLTISKLLLYFRSINVYTIFFLKNFIYNWKVKRIKNKWNKATNCVSSIKKNKWFSVDRWRFFVRTNKRKRILKKRKIQWSKLRNSSIFSVNLLFKLFNGHKVVRRIQYNRWWDRKPRVMKRRIFSPKAPIYRKRVKRHIVPFNKEVAFLLDYGRRMAYIDGLARKKEINMVKWYTLMRKEKERFRKKTRKL